MILLFFMNSHPETFKKSGRLCSLKAINNLFETGRSLNLRIVRVVYIISDDAGAFPPVRLLISVPKRNFKKAVDRNLIKRRIREAFRKNKNDLYELLKTKKKNADIAIIWTANSALTYSETETVVREMIHKIPL